MQSDNQRQAIGLGVYGKTLLVLGLKQLAASIHCWGSRRRFSTLISGSLIEGRVLAAVVLAAGKPFAAVRALLGHRSGSFGLSSFLYSTIAASVFASSVSA